MDSPRRMQLKTYAALEKKLKKLFLDMTEEKEHPEKHFTILCEVFENLSFFKGIHLARGEYGEDLIFKLVEAFLFEHFQSLLTCTSDLNTHTVVVFFNDFNYASLWANVLGELVEKAELVQRKVPDPKQHDANSCGVSVTQWRSIYHATLLLGVHTTDVLEGGGLLCDIITEVQARKKHPHLSSQNSDPSKMFHDVMEIMKAR